ncbi:MAG: Gfo/Idh/MocA family protein [Thermomicrobiales bacterium]
MDNVRVGIVGAGWVAQNRHLPGLRHLPGVDVQLIWSRRLENARAVAADFGIPGVAQDWRAVVESPDVDAVIVATPPNLHCPVTRAALSAGKHVLCQGRMARNLSEAQQMLRDAETAGVIAALYPPRPGLKGDRVVRRLLHEEEFLGDVREVRVAGMTLAEPKAVYDWTADPDVVGVNAMALGLWVEVQHRWVGPATRVVATGRSHRRQRTNSAGAEVEARVPDSLAIAADLACGATASLHFSSCAAFGPGNAMEIYGSRGALIYRFFVEELLGATADDEHLRPIPIPPEEERFQTTDAEFIEAIRGGTAVSPTFRDGVDYMAFCEAVARSLATGSAVDVPPAEPAMDSWERFLTERHRAGGPLPVGPVTTKSLPQPSPLG